MSVGIADIGRRSDEPVRIRQLGVVCVYWLGLATVFAGLSSILAGRLQYERLVPPGTEGSALFQMTALGIVVAVIIQPTIGAISDHTRSRLGRRKPYILVGGLLDVVFLTGIATSNTVVTIAAFFLLLQVSSNAAQGAFQAYVPDVVPARQVGLASALVGLMQILGNVTGYIVGAIGIATGSFACATVAIGLLEVTTMLALVVGARDGPQAPARDGRGWASIARSAWGIDVLRERTFLWLVGSRFFVLMGGSVLVNLAPFFLSRSFGVAQDVAGQLLVGLVLTVALGTAASVFPAARLSDRIGRKPVIAASCLLGGAGLLVCAVAPVVPVAFAGSALFGISAGTFLAVDWALLVESIPRAAAGRFMGLSNVATAAAGISSIAAGGLVMDVVGGPGRDGSGPRAALVVGAGCFAVGVVLLARVREPRRA